MTEKISGGEKKRRLIEALGLLAGALTTASFIPQVILVWNLRPAPATAVSLPMYAILCYGVLCWFIYGIAIKSRPVALWNAVTGALASSILVYKLIYG